MLMRFETHRHEQGTPTKHNGRLDNYSIQFCDSLEYLCLFLLVTGIQKKVFNICSNTCSSWRGFSLIEQYLNSKAFRLSLHMAMWPYICSGCQAVRLVIRADHRVQPRYKLLQFPVAHPPLSLTPLSLTPLSLTPLCGCIYTYNTLETINTTNHPTTTTIPVHFLP